METNAEIDEELRKLKLKQKTGIQTKTEPEKGPDSSMML